MSENHPVLASALASVLLVLMLAASLCSQAAANPDASVRPAFEALQAEVDTLLWAMSVRDQDRIHQQLDWLASHERWLSLSQRRWYRYARLTQLAGGEANDISQAHELVAGLPGEDVLTGLAQARLVMATQRLGVRPDLLAFLTREARTALQQVSASESVQRVLQHISDALVVLALRSGVAAAELSPLPGPFQTEYSARLQWHPLASQSQLYGPVFDRRWMTALPQQQRLDTEYLEALLLWRDLLRQTRADQALSLYRYHLGQAFERHLDGLRSWQNPLVLRPLLNRWREPELLPDSDWIDRRFLDFVGCDYDPERAGPKRCWRISLNYLLQRIIDPQFRREITYLRELDDLLMRLQPLLQKSESLLTGDRPRQTDAGFSEAAASNAGAATDSGQTGTLADEDSRLSDTNAGSDAEVGTALGLDAVLTPDSSPSQWLAGQWWLEQRIRYEIGLQQGRVARSVLHYLARERLRLENYQSLMMRD